MDAEGGREIERFTTEAQRRRETYIGCLYNECSCCCEALLFSVTLCLCGERLECDYISEDLPFRPRNRPLRCRRHQRCVFPKYARRIAGLRRLPLRHPALNFSIA